MLKNYAEEDTQLVSQNWKNLSNSDRLNTLESLITKTYYEQYISFVRAEDSGSVYIAFKSPLSSKERGTMLLDLEQHLKINLDQGICIWCEPLGDKNSLRNLRGIQIKSEKSLDEI